MKHLFTLSERLKGRGRGSATSASAIFCKLVGMVKLFMPFMKATRRQSDTTIFAESLKSLKSLMSIFAESAESAESAKPIFANRGVKDVRVSLDQYPMNIQRISNLYLTPNRYLTRFAAVFALVFVMGVGNVWGGTATFSGWSYSGGSITGGTLSGAPVGATASLTTTYTNANQMTKSNSHTLTLSGFDGCTITGVKVHVKTNGSSGGGSGTLTINGSSKGTLASTGVIGGTYTDKAFSVTSTTVGTGKTVVVKLTASANSFYCDSYTITYTAAAPAYTITASSNNTSWGTVSVSGTTITATPADCYQVASGTSGYNKISGTGTITHTGNSNTISVTPTSNCSIQVIFEKKIVNTYIDEIQDNGEFEDCSTSAPSLTDKSAATTGTCAQQHWHFVGWVTAANKANPTDANIIEAGEAVAVNGTTYYAVWAKGSAGSSATVTFSPTSDGSEITNSISSYVESSSGISSYSGTKVYEGAYGLKLGSSNYAGTVTCTLSSSITTKTITIDAKKYGSDTGTLSCKVNGNTTFGTTQSPSTSGGVLTFTNANAVTINSVSISTSSKRGYVKTITIGEAATYSDYITTCCTALAQVEGSANLSLWNAGFIYIEKLCKNSF